MADSRLSTTARPTFTVAGQERPQLANGLLTLMVAERVDGLYRCEATFGNWGESRSKLDYLYFDRSVLDFGKTFVIKLGADTLFTGSITALEGQFPDGRAPEITVLAEDRLQDLRMTRRTRTFADVSDADVFQQVAGDYGLTPSVSINGPTHKVLAQVNQSDLAFLRERARAVDAELWMDGSSLNVKQHSNRTSQPVTLAYGIELSALTVAADVAHQRTSVAVNGWDVSGKSAIAHEAGESAISSELGSDTSGASILKSAFGDRKEAIAHAVPLTSQEAQDAAEAAFRLRARQFVSGQGVSVPSAALRAGAFVDLRGLGPLFSGKYYVSEVRHLFDALGLRTEFTVERPGVGAAA
jgi:phage protein D